MYKIKQRYNKSYGVQYLKKTKDMEMEHWAAEGAGENFYLCRKLRKGLFR